MGGINSRDLFFHDSGSQKAEIEVQTGSALFSVLSPCLADGRFRTVSSRGCPSVCMLCLSFYMDTVILD